MKKLTSFFLVALLSASSAFASDETIVANWQFPIDGWFAGAAAPAVGIDAYPRAQAEATMVANFDAATADFDAAWASAGTANILGADGKRLGLAGSDNGAADFTGSFKTLYDDNNMYILVQWTDDDVTGTESAEICLSPYLKLDAADRADAVGGEWYHTSTAWYTRYSQFGANKLVFKKTGFDAAMMVNFSEAGVGSINWGGTTPTLTNNLFVDDKTAPASKTVKWIISIGYPVLTGTQRPDFNKTIWAGLNGGKGISFDLKLNDTDADDALNADATPVAKPAEYWWNTTSNDCWQANFYAGFLAPKAAPVIPVETIVANWQFPIDGWFAGAAAPAVGIDAYPRAQAQATIVANFDAATADFDAAWTSAGTANTLGADGKRLGLAASDNGAADFAGSFKTLYDDNNMYILVQWTDDDVTGTESAEICISPYLKLDAADRADAVGGEWYHTSTAWYTRYMQFGASKLAFKKTGFDAAMMVNFSEAGVGSINWGGTTPTLTNNLFVDDKTAPASKVVKWIITIGYPVLTGTHRPDFNKTIWAGLNGGKGISFDLKLNDTDANDALNADATPVAKPAEYWWNTTSNDCWQATFYAGFLAPASANAVKEVKMLDFAKITANSIELNTPSDVVIYNIAGKQIVNVKNATSVNISNLTKGAYIVRANNQTQKFIR